MIHFKNKNKGFTLVELLVVIAIIGLLSSIVLLSMSSTKGGTRDARRLEDLHQLRLALDLYFNRYGQYPSDGDVACTGFVVMNGQDDLLTTALKNEGLFKGTTDPEINSGCYYYYGTPSWWWSCSKDYQIEMRLETREAAAAVARAGGDCWDYSGGYNWGSGDCAGYNCSFPSP